MGIKELKQSSTFVIALLALTLISVPFGIERIGEVSGLFEFPVRKTVVHWFKSSAPADEKLPAKSIDWLKYRQEFDQFNAWEDRQEVPVIFLPTNAVEVFEIADETTSELELWSVRVTSCTPADREAGRKGYVFIAGFDRAFDEGSTIAPADGKCGFEIVCIGERSVWFRGVFDAVHDVPMGVVKFPDFRRIEGESLVYGTRRYVPRDAFEMRPGGWLVIDSFLPPDAAVFRILDHDRRQVSTLLCIVIDEKGGR